MDASAFWHEPLHPSRHQIRLMKMKYRMPGTLSGRADSVKCKLETFDFDIAPPYYALSYTWGPATDTRMILLNDCAYHVSKNLFEFLAVAGSLYTKRYFWIDQLSIDQKNTEERNKQVMRMGKIYQHAELVLAWLGAFDGYIDEAFESIRVHSRGKHEKVHLQAMDRLIKHEYWTRLWIVQELKVAHKVVFATGRSTIPMEKLNKGLQFMSDACGWWIPSPVLSLTSGPVVRRGAIQNLAAQGSSSKIWRTVLPRRRSQAINGERPWQWQHLTLQEVLEEFAEQSCKDPRDRIFGLQTIVPPEQRIVVDYTKTVHEVFLLTIMSIMKHGFHPSSELSSLLEWGWSSQQHLASWPLNSPKPRHSVVLYDMLLRVLIHESDKPAMERVAQGLVWAYLLANFSRIREGVLEDPKYCRDWRHFVLRMTGTAMTSDQRALSTALTQRFMAHLRFPNELPADYTPRYQARYHGQGSLILQKEEWKHMDNGTVQMCAPTKECRYCDEITAIYVKQSTEQRPSMAHLDQIVLDVAAEYGFVEIGGFFVHPNDPYFGLFHEVGQQRSDE